MSASSRLPFQIQPQRAWRKAVCHTQGPCLFSVDRLAFLMSLTCSSSRQVSCFFFFMLSLCSSFNDCVVQWQQDYFIFFLKPDAVGRSAFSLFYFFFYFQGVRYRITWSNYATTISVVAIAMRSPPRRILNPSRLFASDRHFLALVPSCCVSVLRWSPAQVFIVYRWQSCYTAIYRIIGLTCLRFHS